MTTPLLLLALVLGTSAEFPDQSEPPRKPNQFAPSLPQLTDEEEATIDKIVNGFIRYDLGQLTGGEGKRANKEFLELGPETIPGLIRGLNRAAKIEGSCPVVTIAKKLAHMLRASNDMELLQFARENIGAGVGQTSHIAVLKDLRVICMFRQRAVAQRDSPVTPVTPVRFGRTSLTSSSNLEARESKHIESTVPAVPISAPAEKGANVQGLADLAAVAADDSDPQHQQRARELLDRGLSRLSRFNLKQRLQDDLPEVRAAAARVMGREGFHFEGELIDRLADDRAGVRDAAHHALTKLNPNVDFGPTSKADEKEVTEAVAKWRAWWAKQNRP